MCVATYSLKVLARRRDGSKDESNVSAGRDEYTTQVFIPQAKPLKKSQFFI
jgi:hypothetical protein